MGHPDGEGPRGAIWDDAPLLGGGGPEFPPGPGDVAAWRLVAELAPWLLPALGRGETESALRLLVDGVGRLGRTALLRLAGNGVVPAQAELAVRNLLATLEDR